MITHPFLKDILADWFREDEALSHFYVRQLMTDWIVCGCIDWRHSHGAVRVSFKVENDRVVLTHWPTSPYMSTRQYFKAGDPSFLSNLRHELLKVCVYGTYFPESQRAN